MGVLSKGWNSVTGNLIGNKGYDDASANINFKPFNIRTGMGNLDWSSGNGVFTLSPEYQDIRNSVLDSSKGFFSQAKTFDPNQASSNAYELMQRIAGPQRERDIANLRSSLFGMGTLGAADATGGNPELRAYYEAQNKADLEAQLQSIGLGQSLIDSLINRGQSLLDTGQSLDESGNKLFTPSIQTGIADTAADVAQSKYIAEGGKAKSIFWNRMATAGVSGGSQSEGGKVDMGMFGALMSMFGG